MATLNFTKRRVPKVNRNGRINQAAGYSGSGGTSVVGGGSGVDTGANYDWTGLHTWSEAIEVTSTDTSKIAGNLAVGESAIADVFVHQNTYDPTSTPRSIQAKNFSAQPQAVDGSGFVVVYPGHKSELLGELTSKTSEMKIVDTISVDAGVDRVTVTIFSENNSTVNLSLINDEVYSELATATGSLTTNNYTTIELSFTALSSPTRLMLRYSSSDDCYVEQINAYVTSVTGTQGVSIVYPGHKSELLGELRSSTSEMKIVDTISVEAGVSNMAVTLFSENNSSINLSLINDDVFAELATVTGSVSTNNYTTINLSFTALGASARLMLRYNSTDDCYIEQIDIT